MRKRRVVLVVVLSTCMAATTMQATNGLEPAEAVQENIAFEEPLTETIPEESIDKEDSPVQDNDTPDIPETGLGDAETPPETPEEPEIEVPEPELPEQEPEIDVPEEELPEGEPEVDAPVEEQPEQEQPGQAQPEPEQKPTTDIPKQNVTKLAPVKQSIEFRPSMNFIPNSKKVTYNVAIPIVGLPSFVTQEMVVGALKCQDETGYPASVTIAQIIQESGYGKYGPGGVEGKGLSYLAYQYNNLFGIKGSGTAGSVDMLTGEQTTVGENYTITTGFRVYNTYTECIEDRTKLLRNVYSDLTHGVTDANTFAVKVGGRWATSINYGSSLIQQMETYDLYRLDRMTLRQFSDMIGRFANPCPGAKISSEFGWRSFTQSDHKGIDLGTGSENLPTYAAEAGTVVTAGWDDAAGNWIVIDHGNGLRTTYMHHQVLYVKEGQTVEKGQQIGLSGTTGRSTGNHLHFQVEENGNTVDPKGYLEFAE